MFRLKGVTPDYSLFSMSQKIEYGEEVTIKELLLNDYYCLYKTFEKIINIVKN